MAHESLKHLIDRASSRIRSVSRLIALCASKRRLLSGVFQGPLRYNIFPPPDNEIEALWEHGNTDEKRIAKRLVIASLRWYGTYRLHLETYSRLIMSAEADEVLDSSIECLHRATGSLYSYKISSDSFGKDDNTCAITYKDTALSLTNRYICIIAPRAQEHSVALLEPLGSMVMAQRPFTECRTLPILGIRESLHEHDCLVVSVCSKLGKHQLLSILWRDGTNVSHDTTYMIFEPARDDDNNVFNRVSERYHVEFDDDIDILDALSQI